MCLNSSSPSNSSSGFLFHQLVLCFYTRVSWYSGLAFLSVNLVVGLPICVSVLYLGLQQQRHKISHSDAFTYHVAAIQILAVFASMVSIIGSQLCNNLFLFIGIYMFYVNSAVFLLFQCLTCGERYFAVVHPITYLRLKKQTLARNVICALIWLQALVQGFSARFIDVKAVGFVSVYVGIALVFAYILFCNISVLVALLRPRPGDGARKNTSTQRAFNTISAILGTLVLKSVADIAGNITALSPAYSVDSQCSSWLLVGWFSLPSNVILQVLYLQRAGKLPFCQRAQRNTAD